MHDWERMKKLQKLQESLRAKLEEVQRIAKHVSTSNHDFTTQITAVSRPEQATRTSELPMGALHTPGNECQTVGESHGLRLSLLGRPGTLVDVETCVNLLIADFGRESHSGGDVLRQARPMRLISPTVLVAFEAASLLFVGKRYEQRVCEVAGNAKYQIVLSMLRNDLEDEYKTLSTELLLAVFLAIVIETTQETSQNFLPLHQYGGLHILQRRTPFRHSKGLEQSIFIDLRLYWVTAALACCEPTFMADKEWLTVPWLSSAPDKDILHQLLDIAVEIPGWLFRSRKLEGSAKDSTDLAEQVAVRKQSNVLQERLRCWVFTNVVVPDRIPEEESGDDMNTAVNDPVFEFYMMSAGSHVVARNLRYPDLLLATSMCLYWALSIIIMTRAEPRSHNVLAERYVYACNICRSMKFYVCHAPRCLVVHMMFAFRTACETFQLGTVERESAEALITLVEKWPKFSDNALRVNRHL
ncbi:hypothetical protein ABHI18_010866 [Aspergillus niger]